MQETGMLSIVKQRYTFQVRYASFNPFDMDRAPYPCADEDALITVLGYRHLVAPADRRSPAERKCRGPACGPL